MKADAQRQTTRRGCHEGSKGVLEHGDTIDTGGQRRHGSCRACWMARLPSPWRRARSKSVTSLPGARQSSWRSASPKWQLAGGRALAARNTWRPRSSKYRRHLAWCTWRPGGVRSQRTEGWVLWWPQGDPRSRHVDFEVLLARHAPLLARQKV